MKPTQKIISKSTAGNGVVIYWVESRPNNKSKGTYPVRWGYVFNGVKYTSRKKADEAANNFKG